MVSHLCYMKNAHFHQLWLSAPCGLCPKMLLIVMANETNMMNYVLTLKARLKWHMHSFRWPNQWCQDPLRELLFSHSVVSDSATPWTAAHKASLSFIIFWSLLKLIFFDLMMPSNHLILCRPLLLLPSIFPSIRVFSNESALCIRWSKYWSFSFSISPSSEYSGLISFRIDRFQLLTVQGTLLFLTVASFSTCCCFFCCSLLSGCFSASGSPDLWIFKLSPLLWYLSPSTHTVSCPFSLCLTSSIPRLENRIGLLIHYPGWTIPVGQSNASPFQCHLPSLSGCPDGLTLVPGSFICGQSDGGMDKVGARGCS